jgi:hypothetical protein
LLIRNIARASFGSDIQPQPRQGFRVGVNCGTMLQAAIELD